MLNNILPKEIINKTKATPIPIPMKITADDEFLIKTVTWVNTDQIPLTQKINC